MKVQCLEKDRDSKGRITRYILLDETGKIFPASGEQIKEEMKGNTYEFTNLQIDKIGRLVDKVDKEKLNAVNQNKMLGVILGQAYKMLLRGNDIGFGVIEFNSKTWDLLSEKKINTALKKAGITLNPIELAHCFENYIIQNNGQIPCKLHIQSKDGVINMVNYCLETSEIKLKGFISEYVGDQEQYFKPDSYIVNSNCENNKIYIAPDMSIVSAKMVDNTVQNKAVNNKNKGFINGLFHKIIK